jgi:hypothetical protein
VYCHQASPDSRAAITNLMVSSSETAELADREA